MGPWPDLESREKVREARPEVPLQHPGGMFGGEPSGDAARRLSGTGCLTPGRRCRLDTRHLHAHTGHCQGDLPSLTTEVAASHVLGCALSLNYASGPALGSCMSLIGAAGDVWLC